MASKSLAKNEYYNKLVVNRLNALKLKTEIEKPKESYLFSLDIKDGEYKDGVLSFNNDFDLITFSDRPFRYVKNSESIKAENELKMLFSSNSSNSFREDPPNAVLVTSIGQSTYEIIKIEVTNLVTNNIVRMEIKALSDDLDNISGKMSLFIDGSRSYHYTLDYFGGSGTANLINYNCGRQLPSSLKNKGKACSSWLDNNCTQCSGYSCDKSAPNPCWAGRTTEA